MTDQPQATPEKGTKYVVLAGSEGAWRRLSTVTAQGADAAIKQAAAAAETPDGTSLVAVPERSWKPRKVTVETELLVRLS